MYAMAIGIARVTGVLLLPVLTRRLTDSDLGVFGLLTSALALLQYASGLGLDSAATRWFYEAEASGLDHDARTADRRRTLSTWVWATVFVGIGLSAAGALAAGPLARVAFEGTAADIRATRAAALAIPGLAMINVLQHWYRMVRRPTPALLVAIAVAASTLVLTVLLVAIGHAGVAGVFGAQAAVGAAVTIAGLAQMWPAIGPPRVDRARFRTMLRYSIPLLPSVASPLLLGLLTRLLIRSFADVDEVGQFQVVSMLATVVILFTTAFQQAWEPYALSMIDREQAKPIYRAAFLGYAAMAGLFGCFLAALFPLALPILGSRFTDLSLPVLIFGASMLVGGALPIINTGPSIAGTGRPAFEAMLVGSAVNVALCAALIPSLGQEGACWASLITAFLLVVIALARSERVWRVDFPLTRAGVVVVIAVGLSTVLHLVTAAAGAPLLLRVAAASVILAIGATGGAALLIGQVRQLRSG